MSAVELTPNQTTRYEEIIDRYLKFLNSFVQGEDHIFTPADAWSSETQILSVEQHDAPGFENLEVWVLTWGTGDEGGPAVLIAVFQKLATWEDNVYRLTSILQHFDTSTQEIFNANSR